jgi:cytochrome c biogenesis protein CcdA
LAGVGCSAPIFLSVLVYAISSGLINGVITFITYALGMGVPLIITSVLLAEAKEYIIRKISRATPLLQKSSGIVLIIVGIYLLYLYYTN